MSIRYLAIQLYQAIRKVGELERRLMQVGPNERSSVEAQLEAARRERDRLRKVLDAKKGG
jgi:hypothetical protein